MTTLADVIAETKNMTLGTFRSQFNLLSGNITDTQNTLTVSDDVGGIQPGARIGVDLELMYVRSVTGKSATVLRGMDGSTKATHLDGSVITVNPIMPDFLVQQAIVQDLYDLNGIPDMFGVQSLNITFNPAVYSYDLPLAGVQDILEIRYKTPGPDKLWPMLRSFRWDPNANTTDFPSGQSLTLFEPAFPGQPMQVTAAVDFVFPTALTDDMVTHVGLPQTATDLPAIGAAIRLSAPREISRNFQESQGMSRRAAEVPPGANMGAANALQKLRQDRLSTEVGNLHQLYPSYRRRIY